MPDDQKTALDVVRYELNYRREKQWEIFSWIATILVTIISGLVALTGKGDWKLALWQKVIMSGQIVVITIYACTWIHENIRFEKLAHEKIVAYLKDETILVDPGRFILGYNGTIVLLMFAAIAALWFCPLTSPTH